MRLVEASPANIENILKAKIPRPSVNDPGIMKVITEIIEDVIGRGDKSLFEQVKKFDGAELKSLKVSSKEIDIACNSVSREFAESIRHAKERIQNFHKTEKPKSWSYTDNGFILGEIVKPLESVGCYVPGGKAAYPSSVLMTVIPAKIASVERIIICTPCANDGSVNPYTLAAASEAGCGEIYKIGGAAAVAAMAYGTDTVPKVAKIIGPGNIYVTAAKKYVYGDTGIDGLAGPSEVVVIADTTANPRLAALDMMAQAEHGSGASAILITTDEGVGRDAIQFISREFDGDTGCFLFLKTGSLDEALEIANLIAPEHVELMVDEPMPAAERIRNAGAILLGSYTPASFGDYIAGPNHVLPTGGAAVFQSALGVRDFVKFISLLSSNKDSIARLVKDIATIANAEGLKVHARAAMERK